MIPSTFDQAKDFIEAMEFRQAEGMTKADWEAKGYMAVLEPLTSPKDFLAGLLQVPACARLPFCLEACLLAGKEVQALMPRPAKAVFEDLIINVHLMDNRERQERIWARAAKTLKAGFREDPTLPRLPLENRAAGTVAYQAALIYCTPGLPLSEAHRALENALCAAKDAQDHAEGGSTLLPKLLPLVQREYTRLLQAAKVQRIYKRLEPYGA